MTWGDAVVLAVLLLILYFVIRSWRKNRKKGCSCGCGNCAHKDICHSSKQKE